MRAAGAKAIVMINRRGFAPWLTCRSCGRHWSCPNCDVSLIVHRHSGRLVCHHCAHAEPLPAACADCDSTTLSRAGAGTEQIEALLAERLAPMPVFRLDSDTAAGRGAHARILAAFGEADSGVLVGTQMVAKGHDFPEVTLSAILDADATLRFPDFRADERTFAMVTQLAGRSGRGDAGGEVIVQTLAPGAPSIAHAARHDAGGFLAEELERRRALRYPPFSHLIRIVLKAESEQRLDRVAAELADALVERDPRRHRPARPGADVPRPQSLPPPPPAQGRRPRGDDRRGPRHGRGSCRRAGPAGRRDRRRRRSAVEPSRPGRVHTIDPMGESAKAETVESRESELEAELLERREAALAHVVKFGDPVLKSKASPVRDFGPELRAEAERMIAIMRDGMGVGLAATQLGLLRRLLVFQAGPDSEPTALVNPEVEWLSDEVVVAEEGCLSLPRVSMDVERPLHARVVGRDVEGTAMRIEASGLEARVLQHEIDHLDGVLILDHAPRQQRKGALRALREGGAYSPLAEESEAGEAGEHREPKHTA